METQECVQTGHTDNSWVHDGWSPDLSSVGWHEGWEQTFDNSASSFSLGGLDLGATSSPKRFEWVKMNLDTGAAVNTFPLNSGPDGAGDGRFLRTASGEWLPDGGVWQLKGYDENGVLRSLNGRLTGLHKVLCGAAQIARVGRQDFYLGHDGGYMIPIYSKNCSRNENDFEKLVSRYGKNELVPVYFENNIFQFLFETRSPIHRNQQCEQCSAVGKRVWQSSALESPMETLNRGVAPIGDDMK